MYYTERAALWTRVGTQACPIKCTGVQSLRLLQEPPAAPCAVRLWRRRPRAGIRQEQPVVSYRQESGKILPVAQYRQEFFHNLLSSRHESHDIKLKYADS